MKMTDLLFFKVCPLICVRYTLSLDTKCSVIGQMPLDLFARLQHARVGFLILYYFDLV